MSVDKLVFYCAIILTDWPIFYKLYNIFQRTFDWHKHTHAHAHTHATLNITSRHSISCSIKYCL